MNYRSESIATAVGRMNRQYFLPAIQREFVWKPEQIVELFDSVLRGYPISSFLFWELLPENRAKWQVYKFLENAKHGGMHNELANTDGVADLTMVLDGQQRLTSLMIGLKGSYWVKKKYGRSDNPDTWSVQKLHIDLLADPKLESDGNELNIYYKFAFMDVTPVPNADHYWFRVGQIMVFDQRQKLDDFLAEADDKLEISGLTKSERRIFERNLVQLYQSIHVEQVIAYYTEKDQNYDRVLDIFVRANEGGTKLSKSDLLLSMVTSKWNGMDARREIFDFVDHINTDLTRKNEFDKDFIMKSCLVLTDLPVAYKVQNFSNANLDLIRREWPAIKQAVRRGVDLANTFGIDRDNLTSVNALIPIIYFFLKNPGATLLGSTPFDARNADRIRRWLVMVLLKGAFGRAADGLLTGIRSKIQMKDNPGADFPLEEINATIATTGLTTVFDDYAIEDIFSRSYRGKQTFLALSLLYDDATWGTISFHQDHIFAASLFDFKDLMDTNRSSWYGQKDKLANLCLLMGAENIRKQDMAVHDWLGTRDGSFLKRHLIPDDRALWEFDRFPDFMKAREKLIRSRLKSLFDMQ